MLLSELKFYSSAITHMPELVRLWLLNTWYQSSIDREALYWLIKLPQVLFVCIFVFGCLCCGCTCDYIWSIPLECKNMLEPEYYCWALTYRFNGVGLIVTYNLWLSVLTVVSKNALVTMANKVKFQRCRLKTKKSKIRTRDKRGVINFVF